MAKQKIRAIKNYEKLDEQLRKALEQKFPNGYSSELRTFDVGGGKFMTALPFETDDFMYLIKFPVPETLEDEQDNLGGEDDLNLEGGEDVDEEEEQDEVEKPTDNIEDFDVADESSPEA